MSDRYTLRPEDFRYSWTNAYQLAMTQVAEMQEKADFQIEYSKVLIDTIIRLDKSLQKKLLHTGESLLREMENTFISNRLLTKQALDQLINKAERLGALHEQIAKDTVRLDKRITQLKYMSITKKLLFIFGFMEVP